MKPVVERWRTEQGAALAEEALARLMTGRGLGALGLGEHEGRIDLRGLLAPLPRRLQRFETQGWFVERLGDLITLQRVRLEKVDLSGAQLQSFRFHDSLITDCRFDGANCRDWRLWGTDVSDCSFVKADLREAAVGTWHEGRRNSWRRTDFSGSDFRVGVSRAAAYEDCNFAGAKLTKVTYGQCSFVRCRFAGSLREVVFDGRELTDRPAPVPLEDVDFSDAVFEQVEFMGFDLERVTLPKDPDLKLLRRYRCVLERGLEALSGNETKPARMLRGEFENRLRMIRSDNEAKVFNRRDYLASGGEDLAILAENVFSRAEADCLAR